MTQNVFFVKNKRPIILTFLAFFALTILLFLTINLINLINPKNAIIIKIIPVDILFGLFIYLKTSVDFVVFASNFIKKHREEKAMELFSLGTSLGNGVGIFLVIFVWSLIKNVKPLLIFSVLAASSFLIYIGSKNAIDFFKYKIASENNNIIPQTNSHLSTFLFSLRLPFILGIDDFAGYIPLFNILNITSFSVGVLLGHCILVSLILANEKLLRKIVQMRFFDLIGAILFLGIGVFGILHVFNFF